MVSIKDGKRIYKHIKRAREPESFPSGYGFYRDGDPSC